jgi:hypothetical protein
MPGEGEPPEIETELRAVALDGREWTVRAVGRARVGGGDGGTPVIQIVFRSGQGDEMEALVVGRTLAELSESGLEEALRIARPHRPERDPEPFFDGTRHGGTRRRG